MTINIRAWSLTLALFLLTGTAPLFGQSTNHAQVVAVIKAQLQAAGVDLQGPCGAYAIVKRVAWELRGESAGTLDKPSGNNCEGRATDIIAYPTGDIVDVLVDGGGANNPTWNVGENVGVGRWHAAENPNGGGTVVPAPGDPGPPPANADSAALASFIQDVRASLARVEAQEQVILDTLAMINSAMPNAESERLRYEAIMGVINALHAPTYKATIFGQSITFRPE